MATAEAAAIVTMSMDKRSVGSVGFTANAIAPARKKTAIAEASAMRKLISLLRRRVTGELRVESDGTSPAVVGMEFPANV